jgi:hypothetical protein
MSALEPLGRMLIILGAVLLVLGVGILLMERLSVPFVGRLPGDILWRRGNVTVYFPLVSCLLLSVALTVVLNLILWLLHR